MKLRGTNHFSMGFLNEYVAVTKRASYDAGEKFPLKRASFKDHMGGIFFIPKKVRVYYNLLEGGPGRSCATPVGVFAGYGRGR
jgi:hypothetical protein